MYKQKKVLSKIITAGSGLRCSSQLPAIIYNNSQDLLNIFHC